jgi:two-component system sensor histidine kinase UhpB
MAGQTGIFTNLRQRVQNLSICARITIGNALVIIVGATAGTLITRHFAAQARDLWLILAFATTGIALSILVNYYIVRAALSPLESLRAFVARVQAGQSLPPGQAITHGDPGVCELAATLTSLVQQLEQSNQQLRSISQRAITAQEAERKRIARSLHDDTAQALSTLIIQLERLERQLPAEAEQTQARIAETRALVVDIQAGLRTIVQGLRPSILDDLGLAPAIRWYARANLEQAGIQVQVDVPEEELALPQELTTTLFRIAQEAINNVQRHSGAKKAVITLRKDLGAVYLSVKDDGHGFQVAQDQGEALRLHQWGLVGIQERVELVGGRFSLTSEPGKGAMLQVCAPLSSAPLSSAPLSPAPLSSTPSSPALLISDMDDRNG